MDITKMTAAQRAELKAQLEAEERAEKQKREESIAAYKSSVDEFCRSKFSRLQALSEEMRRLKEEVFGDAETLIALKDELFRTKSDRHSNQFTTSDGKITVALGYRTNDGWDDTVNVGVDKVKNVHQIAGQRRGFGGFDRDGHESAGEGSQGKSEGQPRTATARNRPQIRLPATDRGHRHHPERLPARRYLSVHFGILQGRQRCETNIAALVGGHGVVPNGCLQRFDSAAENIAGK